MRRWRSALTGLTGLLLLLGSTTGVAQAHVLKENNGISAVLHIPPEDNPEAGQPTELDLSFGDENGTFGLPDCHCSVLVQHNGKLLQTVVPRPALSGATLEAVTTVNFPNIGVYDVIVQGSARDGKFPAFKLDYLERVATVANAPATSDKSSGSLILMISTGSLAILSFAAYSNITRSGRYRPSAKRKPKLLTKSKKL